MSRLCLRACALLLIALTQLGCAPGRELMRAGQDQFRDGRSREGLASIEQALALEPDNREYRMELIRRREQHLGTLLTRADVARAAGQLDEAQSLYREVLELAPNQPRAVAGQRAVDALRDQAGRLEQARQLTVAGRDDEAQRLIGRVLSDNPGNAQALTLRQQAVAAGRRNPEPVRDAVPVLRASLRKPVSLEFRDAALKSVFEALSRSTGINFVFDREVRGDNKVTLSFTDLSVEDVVAVLAASQQLEHKVLNDNTVLVYPNTPPKQKEHQELAVRTFYLANADVKGVFAMLKTVLKSRDLHADERLNSLTLRDTPDAIRLAERLIAAQDLAEPEVVLDVEVLEVKRSRLQEIGIEPPGKLSVLNIVANPATVVSTATGSTTVLNNTLTTTQLTLDKLRGLNGSSIGIDSPSLNLRSEVGDTNILANPRIRVKNRDKARILIGDRVPVITTVSTANVGVSESVSYLDVGLKLDVEPTVFLDNDVGVKVVLEVSNVVREVRSRSGSLTYQIGTRLASTNLRLRDGETQALAGLINDEDRRNVVGVPGMTDLPILGRLLSSERGDRSKTEIVLLITPRVVRNLGETATAQGAWLAGTEGAVGAAPVGVRGGSRIVTGAGSGSAVGPASAPAPAAPDAPKEAGS